MLSRPDAGVGPESSSRVRVLSPRAPDLRSRHGGPHGVQTIRLASTVSGYGARDGRVERPLLRYRRRQGSETTDRPQHCGRAQEHRAQPPYTMPPWPTPQAARARRTVPGQRARDGPGQGHLRTVQAPTGDGDLTAPPPQGAALKEERHASDKDPSVDTIAGHGRLNVSRVRDDGEKNAFPACQESGWTATSEGFFTRLVLGVGMRNTCPASRGTPDRRAPRLTVRGSTAVLSGVGLAEHLPQLRAVAQCARWDSPFRFGQ